MTNQTLAVGDRVKNIRPAIGTINAPNGLPLATVIDIADGTVWIKYDDDSDDIGWAEDPNILQRIETQ